MLGTFVIIPMVISQRLGVKVSPGKVENDAAAFAEVLYQVFLCCVQIVVKTGKACLKVGDCPK